MSPSRYFTKGSIERKVVMKSMKYTSMGGFVLVCFPCYMYWVGKAGVKKGRKWTEAERYKVPPKVSQREDAIVEIEEGKSSNRKRRFMRGLSRKGSKDDVADATIETKDDSGWTKLPYEIRSMIYEEYFCADETITVMFDSEWKVRGRFRTMLSDSPEDEALLPTGHVNLLRTCKSIYRETLPLLYSRPTYEFFNPIAFLIFCATITPNAFHCLNNITLDFLTFKHRDEFIPYIDWPEPPQVWYKRGCCLGYEPAIKQPLLQRWKNYRNFRLGGNQQYYNPIVIDACGNKLFRKLPTIWIWTCTVLGKINSLRNLDVQVREDMVRPNESVRQSLINAGIQPGGRPGIQSVALRLWVSRPRDDPEDPGEEYRFRYVLVGDEGRWNEISREEWESGEEVVTGETTEDSTRHVDSGSRLRDELKRVTEGVCYSLMKQK